MQPNIDVFYLEGNKRIHTPYGQKRGILLKKVEYLLTELLKTL